MKPKISALMSVYKNENPDFFAAAIDSILNQTFLPDEIILVRDGIVSEQLQGVIDFYLDKSSVQIKYIPLQKNEGLGNALRIGVEAAKNELIARMDTDDISVQNRFELQVSAFEKNPKLDLVGGQVCEFEIDISSATGARKVPLKHQQIAEYLKRRNAFNHPTVMFKKSSVLKVGNYIDRHYVEDYDLWLRMLSAGCRFENLPQTLVYMRVSADMYNRRGGVEYFESLKRLENDKRIAKTVSPFRYVINVSVRFVQCVVLSNSLRRLVYQKVLRKRR